MADKPSTQQIPKMPAPTNAQPPTSIPSSFSEDIGMLTVTSIIKHHKQSKHDMMDEDDTFPVNQPSPPLTTQSDQVSLCINHQPTNTTTV
jgi:hypothetical protein